MKHFRRMMFLLVTLNNCPYGRQKEAAFPQQFCACWQRQNKQESETMTRLATDSELTLPSFVCQCLKDNLQAGRYILHVCRKRENASRIHPVLSFFLTSLVTDSKILSCCIIHTGGIHYL